MTTSLQDWVDQLHAAISAQDRALLWDLCAELRAQNRGAALELSAALKAALDG